MIQTRVDPKRHRVYTRASGTLTFAELLAHIREEARTEAHRYRELFDASDARTNMTDDEVRHIALLADEFDPPDGPGALAIVASDPYTFGMAHMYQALCENRRVVGVFRGVTAAARWLAAQRPPPIKASKETKYATPVLSREPRISPT